MKYNTACFWIGGMVLSLMIGWGILSFCRTLKKSYRAVRQKEAIRTGEVMRSLAISNLMILVALVLILVFSSDELTRYTVMVSFLYAFRDMVGIFLLSVFCGYQVHKYNTSQ